MSVYYGRPAAPDNGSAPNGKVSFQWIGEAWQLFSGQPLSWILGVLAFAVPVAVIYIIVVAVIFGSMRASGAFTPGHVSASPPILTVPPLFYVISYVVPYAFYPFITAGLLRMAIKQIRGQTISPIDILSGGRYTLRMIAVTVIAGIVQYALQYAIGRPLGVSSYIMPWSHSAVGPSVLTGSYWIFMAVIIGVSLFVQAFAYPAYVLVADGHGIFRALGASLSAVGRHLFAWLGLAAVWAAVCVVSWVPCGLGMFITTPMSFLIGALAYRDLIGMTGVPAPLRPDYGPTDPNVWPPPPSV